MTLYGFISKTLEEEKTVNNCCGVSLIGAPSGGRVWKHTSHTHKHTHTHTHTHSAVTRISFENRIECVFLTHKSVR